MANGSYSHGEIEPRFGLQRLQDLRLRSTGRTPIGVEVQSNRLVGDLRRGQGASRVGLDVERVGQRGATDEEQGDDEFGNSHKAAPALTGLGSWHS